MQSSDVFISCKPLSIETQGGRRRGGVALPGSYANMAGPVRLLSSEYQVEHLFPPDTRTPVEKALVSREH